MTPGQEIDMSEASGPNNKRATPSFLLLQGLATPYFQKLGKELERRGACVHKVNYCGGDWWFSRGLTNTNYGGKHTGLADKYRTLMKSYQVDTIILFGDCRPIHKIAAEVAQEEGVSIVVLEEGYTRPGWVTCEIGGTNNYSLLPRSANAVRARATEIGELSPTEQAPLPNPMPPRVRMDLMFHLANILCFWRFRGYETHRPAKVSEELRGWIARFWRKRQFKKENEVLITLYETTNERYFLVPLQLTSDFQIREHSDYDGVPDFIGEVITSFAKKAGKKDRLLFKSHPLDNGMIDYRSLIGTSTALHGITDRVAYIEGGDLDTLLENTAGVVLINSTVGFATLKQCKPLKVMGRALYDMAGLTHQGSLDTFWKKAAAPEADLVDDFLKVVRHDTQIYGDFFTNTGMELAAKAVAKRLMAKQNSTESNATT